MHEQLRLLYNVLQQGSLALDNTQRLIEAMHKLGVLPPPTQEDKDYCKQMVIDTMPDADKANKNFRYFEALNKWQLLRFLQQDVEKVEAVVKMLKHNES